MKTSMKNKIILITLALLASASFAGTTKKHKKKKVTPIAAVVAASEPVVVVEDDKPAILTASTEIVERKTLESSVETGIKTGRLNNGFGSENGIYSRLTLKMSDKLNIQAEIVQEHKFSNSGNNIAVGATYNFNEDWYVQASYAYSPSGINYAKTKLDYITYYKGLLQNKQLVVGVGIHNSLMKDGHSGTGVSLNGIYYTGGPLVVEGSITRTVNDPGNISTMGYALALTYSNRALFDKRAETVLYLEHSTVGYQDLGTSSLVDYSTNILALREKMWLGEDYGIQVNGELEFNQYYKRRTLNLGIFKDF
jgi:YaiO family outer membrane protein